MELIHIENTNIVFNDVHGNQCNVNFSTIKEAMDFVYALEVNMGKEDLDIERDRYYDLCGMVRLMITTNEGFNPIGLYLTATI